MLSIRARRGGRPTHRNRLWERLGVSIERISYGRLLRRGGSNEVSEDEESRVDRTSGE